MNKESRARRLRLLSLKGLAKSAELSLEEKKQAREASMKQIKVLAAKLNAVTEEDDENKHNTWTAEASCIEEGGIKVPVIKIKYNKRWPETQRGRDALVATLINKFTNKIYVKLDKEFMQHKRMFIIPCLNWNYPNCKEASADEGRYNPCLYFLQRIQPKEWPMNDSTEQE
tara:strand:+ start:18215 stop:18727 length:513 start_codon:yes stop_codon:yes gene_type:complete